jgi:AraC family transcriptional regulator
MSNTSSRVEYAKRMHRVLLHIEQQLEHPLSIHALAQIAHFSPYHFHRLFTAWTGETVGDYVRHRRLAVAAMRMAAQPRVPILHIALSVGYGSAEAFARAFKLRFDASPSAWRQDQSKGNSKIDQVSLFAITNNEISHEFSREVSMNVQLVERQAVSIAYLRHEGPYGGDVTNFWRHNAMPWMMRQGLLNNAMYGISHDATGITEPQRRRYDACVEVAADFMPVEPAFRAVIPGGRYAIYRFEGTVPQLLDAWTVLLRDWLPGSACQLDDRPAFEYFPAGSIQMAAAGPLACEVCVPVTLL